MRELHLHSLYTSCTEAAHFSCTHGERSLHLHEICLPHTAPSYPQSSLSVGHSLSQLLFLLSVLTFTPPPTAFFGSAD